MITLLLLLLAHPPYHRADYPHWRGSCLDVREQVLIAESRRPVTFRDACTLLSGEWLDPYTGEIVTAPGALDVDHRVSLRAAHDAGGWKWSREKKAKYANYLDDPDHLVAVTVTANRQKGSKGPSRWLPRQSNRCHYVASYQRVAQTWNLSLPVADQRVIATILAACAHSGTDTSGISQSTIRAEVDSTEQSDGRRGAQPTRPQASSGQRR